MKKLLIPLFVLLLFSCDSQEYVKISNTSSYEVTFHLKGYNAGTYTLSPGGSDEFKPEMYLESFEASLPRVSFRENNEFEWEFYDNPGIVLRVNNRPV